MYDMMKKQNFGVEIELTGITREQAANVIATYFGTQTRYLGTYYDTYGATDRKGRTWKAMSDGSIYTERKTSRGKVTAGREYSCEVVTPVLQYEDMEAYCGFNGDKDAFCKAFVDGDGEKKIYQARAAEIDRLNGKLLEMDKMIQQSSADYERQLAVLRADLDKELEWKPYEFSQNIPQAEYAELAKCVDSGSARYMTDDEALDWVCREFGFDRSQVTILHEIDEQEINRHIGRVDARPSQRKRLMALYGGNTRKRKNSPLTGKKSCKGAVYHLLLADREMSPPRSSYTAASRQSKSRFWFLP